MSKPVEYSEDYVKELETKLWEMIDLNNKRANSQDYLEVMINMAISRCLKEAEAYLTK